jgi:hypothetical protein
LNAELFSPNSAKRCQTCVSQIAPKNSEFASVETAGNGSNQKRWCHHEGQFGEKVENSSQLDKQPSQWNLLANLLPALS